MRERRQESLYYQQTPHARKTRRACVQKSHDIKLVHLFPFPPSPSSSFPFLYSLSIPASLLFLSFPFLISFVSRVPQRRPIFLPLHYTHTQPSSCSRENKCLRLQNFVKGQVKIKIGYIEPPSQYRCMLVKFLCVYVCAYECVCYYYQHYYRYYYIYLYFLSR